MEQVGGCLCECVGYCMLQLLTECIGKICIEVLCEGACLCVKDACGKPSRSGGSICEGCEYNLNDCCCRYRSTSCVVEDMK